MCMTRSAHVVIGLVLHQDHDELEGWLSVAEDGEASLLWADWAGPVAGSTGKVLDELAALLTQLLAQGLAVEPFPE